MTFSNSNKKLEYLHFRTYYLLIQSLVNRDINQLIDALIRDKIMVIFWVQRRIRNPVKHLRYSVLRKYFLALSFKKF